MFLETKKEIRSVLESTDIKQVAFPDWNGTSNGEGEARTIQLRLGTGQLVLISASSYQTLKIEEL